MNIEKQKVLDLIKAYGLDDLDTSYLTGSINSLPASEDEWVSVGDYVVFEYYTETKCVIDKGIVIWINDNDCCVETGVNKKKRHQMEVSALKRKLIDLPNPPTK